MEGGGRALKSGHSSGLGHAGSSASTPAPPTHTHSLFRDREDCGELPERRGRDSEANRNSSFLVLNRTEKWRTGLILRWAMSPPTHGFSLLHLVSPHQGSRTTKGKKISGRQTLLAPKTRRQEQDCSTPYLLLLMRLRWKNEAFPRPLSTLYMQVPLAHLPLSPWGADLRTVGRINTTF